MSHPLSAYVSERLASGLNNLYSRQRRIRAGVQSFLENQREGGARDVVRRLRRLATFMRLRRESWPIALDRLFSMRYELAEDTISRYRKWVAGKQWKPSLRQHMNAWGFVRLSKELRKQGILDWELKHQRTQVREKRWENCSSAFRIKVQEWSRIERARNLSPATLRRMSDDFCLFGGWIHSRHLSFESLERSDALAWAENEHSRKLSASTFNHRLSINKRFYTWLENEGVIDRSPFESLKYARLNRKLPKVIEESEVAQLIGAAQPGFDKAILEVMYSSGCRVGELCNLDLKEVSFSERTARTIGKGGHDRIIYLNQSALREVKAWLPRREECSRRALDVDKGALFLTSVGTRLNVMSISTVINRTIKKTKLEKHINPHMLRHAFATHMLNRGADIYSIMQFMGHKDIQSTVRYLQVATARLSEVHRKYHPRR